MKSIYSILIRVILLLVVSGCVVKTIHHHHHVDCLGMSKSADAHKGIVFNGNTVEDYDDTVCITHRISIIVTPAFICLIAFHKSYSSASFFSIWQPPKLQ